MADVGDPPRHRARPIVATVLGVVTVLVLTATIVGAWAKATVLRREPLAEMVDTALSRDEVQAGLAAYLADQVAAAVDVEERLTDLLPDGLDRIAATIAGATNSALEGTLRRALANSDVQDTLQRLVERAHDQALRVLSGDGLADGVTVTDGEVALNLLPLVARGLVALQSLGVLSDVIVPELTVEGDPDEQVTELETALGRDLPDGFGQLVVYRSESVAAAQQSVQSAQQVLAVAQRALWLLVVATVVLLAATIAVAVDRWRAVLFVGLGIAATMIVLREAVRRVVDDGPELVDRPGAKAAVDSILDVAGSSLLRVAGVVLVAAFLIVAGAIVRRHWPRADLVLTAAVLLGALTVTLVGASLVGLLVGAAVGVTVLLLARWLIPPPRRAPDGEPSPGSA